MHMLLAVCVKFAGLDDGLVKEADAQAEAYTSEVSFCVNDIIIANGMA